MLWIWIVVASQFCNAAVSLMDKFLLNKKKQRPAVLTFWTAVFNLLALVFALWNFTFFPGWRILIIALLSGAAFTFALHFFYMALEKGETSHISPLVGGVLPIAALVMSYYLLNERLGGWQIASVFLLVLGAILISFEKSRRHSGWHIGMLYAIIAGIFFAASSVLSRAVFLEQSFNTGFVWGRVGCFAAVLPFLFWPSLRKSIFTKQKQNLPKDKTIFSVFIVDKVLSALPFIGMSFAVSLASATLVNALAGIQYAILFILIFALSKKLPKVFKEEFYRSEIIVEIIAIVLIAVGVGLIVMK
ncbi:MAG: DMT family transporter [Parcubacteria group bacterium]